MSPITPPSPRPSKRPMRTRRIHDAKVTSWQVVQPERELVHVEILGNAQPGEYHTSIFRLSYRHRKLPSFFKVTGFSTSSKCALPFTLHSFQLGGVENVVDGPIPLLSLYEREFSQFRINQDIRVTVVNITSLPRRFCCTIHGHLIPSGDILPEDVRKREIKTPR
jgi:hypothetical protein